MPIYLKSLKEWHLIHPTVFGEFQKGFFTVSKTNRLFSCISDDHAHEENKKPLKSDGGVVGILDSAKALLKWMISGPVIASVITKINLEITNAKSRHENYQPFEQRFQKNVTDLVQEVLTQLNSFEERDDTLYTVVSKVMMTQEVKDSVQSASVIGENQCKKFLSAVIEFKCKNIHNVIKKSLAIFKEKNSTSLCKSKQKVLSLKQDCQLYSSLYVACQTRESDL